MDKKVKKFKADYAMLEERVKQIKQKLRQIKKEIKPVAKAAYRLVLRGDETMYDEGKGHDITPKFNGLGRMMEDLEYWMVLDAEIQHTIENML